MHISRIQIEEGFLDSLDIELRPGLNTIIGARGTGKTSLIELIRFALGLAGYTPESSKRSREHALSVLGTGQVTLTLTDGARTVTVSRTAQDEQPRSSGPFPSPIIFSQTEIESVGLQSVGRLRLLDSFAPSRRRTDDPETASMAVVHSLSIELSSARGELEDLDRQLAESDSIKLQVQALGPSEKKLSELSVTAANKKRQLDQVSARLAAASVAIAHAERLDVSMNRWQSALTSTLNAAPIVELPEGTQDPRMQQAVALVGEARTFAARAIHDLGTAKQLVAETIVELNASKLKDESVARELRREAESLQAGAGQVISAGQKLRERLAQLEALHAIAEGKRKHITSLMFQRSRAFDQLEEARKNRFEAREVAAKRLSQLLGPRIRVDVRKAGQKEIYASAIADVLKGSGLRYNDLSVQIAEAVSPRELVEMSETNDVNQLADDASISKDRAARVLAQVRNSNTGALATVLVEDDVDLKLLDGKDYKDISDLSTGQRCTVVLPIVLQHSERVLVIDQPEDHIDNAFITDTVIKAIHARGGAGQLILSTHNANIPVLGNADRVLQLGSDGRRGFPVRIGELSDIGVVEGITSIMEGGLEAFRKRASFYEENAWLL
jgi:hypothetical protein